MNSSLSFSSIKPSAVAGNNNQHQHRQVWTSVALQTRYVFLKL